MNRFLLWFIFTFCCILYGETSCAQPLSRKSLMSAQPIKAGGQKGLTPLSFALSNCPQGAAFTEDTDYPDLFTLAVTGIKPLGLFWSKYLYEDENERLVYSEPLQIKHPWGEKVPPVTGKIFNMGDETWGLWIESGKNVVIAKFDKDNQEFKETRQIPINGKVNPLLGIDVTNIGSHRLRITLLCSDGQTYRPKTYSGDLQSYYDGAGAYRGKLPLCGLYSFEIDIKFDNQVSEIVELTRKNNISISGSSVFKVGSKGEKLDGYIITNTLGVIKYWTSGEEKAQHVFGEDNCVLYHPTQGAKAIAFFSRKKGHTEFIAGGEGALYHYRFSGKMTTNNEPIYLEPQAILRENGDLYSGSLTVPNVVDWDGDGALDIVAGNSEGRLLFIKNNGINSLPDFALPEEMHSAGSPILFRPGYQIVQGPLESAWGYLCPSVIDWNCDGLYDIVFSGSRSKFEVMINRGTRDKAELDSPVPLRLDNMELPGTWRVRPATANINGKNALVILDVENALHLYWQVDNYTVEDGGRLRMEDGSIITFHNNKEPLGQTGRAKLQLVDWDNDNVLDLIIGTVKRSSFPNPERGLPYSRFLKNQIGMQVFVMKNTGTNENMTFAEPLQFQVRNEDLYLGAHSNAPFACELGDASHGLNLIVGVESGKLYFFDRKDLTTIGIEDENTK